MEKIPSNNKLRKIKENTDAHTSIDHKKLTDNNDKLKRSHRAPTQAHIKKKSGKFTKY